MPWLEPVTSATITVEVNGTSYEREVETRRLLIHFLRDDLDLTGSHVGCDTGNCGACSVILDGTLVKSCMLLAVQADGAEIETVAAMLLPLLNEVCYSPGFRYKETGLYTRGPVSLSLDFTPSTKAAPATTDGRP